MTAGSVPWWPEAKGDVVDFYVMLAVALAPVVGLGVLLALKLARMDRFDDYSRHPGMVSGSLQMDFDDARNRRVVRRRS